MSDESPAQVKPLRALSLLLAGRPLLAAQQCGFDQARLERLSRVAGQQGSFAKRGLRLGLYLSVRVARRLPASAWLSGTARRSLPGLHRFLFTRYVHYSRNSGDWTAAAPMRDTVIGGHEAATLRRLKRLAGRLS